MAPAPGSTLHIMAGWCLRTQTRDAMCAQLQDPCMVPRVTPRGWSAQQPPALGGLHGSRAAPPAAHRALRSLTAAPRTPCTAASTTRTSACPARSQCTKARHPTAPFYSQPPNTPALFQQQKSNAVSLVVVCNVNGNGLCSCFPQKELLHCRSACNVHLKRFFLSCSRCELATKYQWTITKRYTEHWRAHLLRRERNVHVRLASPPALCYRMFWPS